MANRDFSTTLIVDQSPKQVFESINDPKNWWSGEIKGSTTRMGDEFTYRYEDLHFSKQRIVEMIPNQKVVWHVVESSINYAEDKAEWTGTKIVFEISEQGNKTHLRFTHQGLHPKIECFESCSNAWSQLIQQALFTLITTCKSKTLILA